MKTKKQTIKLQKSSGLFMQLGLVLTLAIVYAFFEHKTEITKHEPVVVSMNSQEDVVHVTYDDFVIERKVVPQKELPKPTSLENLKIDDTPKKSEPESPIILEHAPKAVDVTKNFVQVEPEDDDVMEYIATVPEVPIYPGCEKGTRAEKKACFEKKVGKFISRKFNTDLAAQLGLPSGKQKIYVQFVITKSGKIEIKGARANHKRLEKEGERVVNLLPQMIPGMKNGKPVKVSYMVPISFNVQ